MKRLDSYKFSNLLRLVSLLVCLVPILAGSSACSPDSSEKIETIIVAVPPLEQNALLYIADSQRFFERQGLKIIIKDFDSGVTSINAMLSEETDMAEAAEFPLIGTLFKNEQLRVIACNDKFENDYIVGRKDRGIEKIPDLKGKKIGVTLRTINEFYLGRFLKLNNINLQDITMVDTVPANFVTSLIGGEIEALIAWQPHISRIRKELNNIVVWPAQSSQPAFGVLVVRKDWLVQNSGLVKKFLTSLKEAEEYLLDHPEESKAIVQKRLNYTSDYINSIWPLHQFALSLDLSLILAMNDESRWMIDNNLTDRKIVPDFKSYIYIDGLKAVKPIAVSITP